MKPIIKILGVLTLVLSLFSCGYEKIDAGYEGIKVNLYGNDKGVDDITLVTGAVWSPDWCDNYTHVFSLRGDSIITKGLLKMKNLLCREI